MNLPPIKFMGSVKNIRSDGETSPFVFEFSNQYSIFDWGIMPDNLQGKGESLAFVTNLFFKLFENKKEWQSWNSSNAHQLKNSQVLKILLKEGLSHHSKGLINENMKHVSSYSKSNLLSVIPINILKPKSRSENNLLLWDYSEYKKRPVDTLVPLEVIFRFNITNGSSLLERANDHNYCKDLGLSSSPKVGDYFTTPIIEFSTKLETKDSYINYAKAKEIASLTENEFSDLIDLTTLLALRLKDYFNEINVELLDGKFEFGLIRSKKDNERNFMLVDSITPDELRLSYKNIQLSKENLRNYYRNSNWARNVKKAKDMASKRGEKDWKSICEKELRSTPEKLSPKTKEVFEMVYKSLANALSQKHFKTDIFNDAYSLDELTKRM